MLAIRTIMASIGEHKMTIYDIKLDQLVKDLKDVRRRLVDGDEDAVKTLKAIIADVSLIRPVASPPPDPALVDRLVTAARKAERVYQFIRNFRRENAGMMPSRREIAAHIDTSSSVVNYYLALLVRDGRLVLSSNKARDISITGLARITTYKCRHCKFVSFDQTPCPDHGDTLVVTDFIEL
jgi:hypothetical protein